MSVYRREVIVHSLKEKSNCKNAKSTVVSILLICSDILSIK